MWASSKGIISKLGFEVETTILQRKSFQGFKLGSVLKEGDVKASTA